MRLQDDQSDLINAHDHCFRNREEILGSDSCGCFYCLAVFSPDKITEWVDEDEDTNIGQTAMCPKCGLDTVIGSRSGFPLTKAFLRKMKHYWFNDTSTNAPWDFSSYR